MISGLRRRLENGAYRVSRFVVRRSGLVMVRAPGMLEIVRLAVVYALGAAALVLLMPAIVVVALHCATHPMGKRGGGVGER